jgi:hypothetical protein
MKTKVLDVKVRAGNHIRWRRKLCGTVMSFALAILLSGFLPGVTAVGDGDGESQTTTWSGTYTVDNDLTIEEGETLVVEPGTVVIFEKDVVLTVKGTLIARGATNSSISLWGYLVEDSGGSGDGSIATIALPGSAIRFAGDTSDGSVITNVTIRSIEVLMERSSMELSNCDISNNSRVIVSGSCSPYVTGNMFHDNGIGNPSEPWSRPHYQEGSWSMISGPTLICSYGTTARVFDNSFVHNGGFGLMVQSASPHVKGNTFSKNRQGGVHIDEAFAGLEPMPILEENLFISHGNATWMATPPSGHHISPSPVHAVGVNIDNADAIFKGNRFEGNEIAITVWMNYSGAPEFHNETIVENAIGVYSYYGSPVLWDCRLDNLAYDFWISFYTHVKAFNTTFSEDKLHIEEEGSLETDDRIYYHAGAGIGLLGLVLAALLALLPAQARRGPRPLHTRPGLRPHKGRARHPLL